MKYFKFLVLVSLSLFIGGLELQAQSACAIAPGANSSYPYIFEAAYNRQGQSSLGCATNQAHWWEGLVIQDFDGGSYGHSAIFHDENQGASEAYVLWGGILGTYWDNSQWGPPVNDMVQAWDSPYGTDGYLAYFNDALDVYTSQHGTYVIRGDTKYRYDDLGGSSSFLGFPTGDGQDAAPSPSGAYGWYQPFEGGILHTYVKNDSTFVYPVRGAIQDKYNSLGGSGGGLGFPISDELTNDLYGCHQEFEHGIIKCNGRLVTEDFTLNKKVRLEADYILSTRCQVDASHPGYGALNNVIPGNECDWIKPRENAMAILGLILATDITGDVEYLVTAQATADFLTQVQDSDGAWFGQYRVIGSNVEPYSDLNKSPTDTAEVMIAFAKLGYDADRWEPMRRGANYLLWLQNPKNKEGQNDGLVAGGKSSGGGVFTDRWAHDNAYAYQALNGAANWAFQREDYQLASRYASAANQIKNGINEFFWAGSYWHTRLDKIGTAYDAPDPSDNSYQAYGWINYAPQMLDVPVNGVGESKIGNWMHNQFQLPEHNGAVSENNEVDPGERTCGNNGGGSCLSPGFSFQAALAWYDLNQSIYASSAIDWAEQSGLWCINCDGGWIDWWEYGNYAAPVWQRFIDTSFYAIAAWSGGYDFNIDPPDVPIAECEPQIYYGIWHCRSDGVEFLKIDGNDSHVHFQVVAYEQKNGSYVSGRKTISSMVSERMNEGAVAGINTDYFGGDDPAQGTTYINNDRIGEFFSETENPDWNFGFPNPIPGGDGICKRHSLAISENNDFSIGWCQPSYNVTGGGPHYLQSGVPKWEDETFYEWPNKKLGRLNGEFFFNHNFSAETRQSAAGISQDGQFLILASSSKVIHPLDMAILLRDIDLDGVSAYDGIRFDGGGSAQMYYDGRYLVSSSDEPDRPVAAGLIVYSERISSHETYFVPQGTPSPIESPSQRIAFDFSVTNTGGTLDVIQYAGCPNHDKEWNFLNTYWDISTTLPNNTFNTIVTFNYYEGDLLQAAIYEDNLKVYYDSGNGWAEATIVNADSVNNTISVETSHFSQWALGGKPISIFLPIVMRNY